jgi:hypothetical protein
MPNAQSNLEQGGFASQIGSASDINPHLLAVEQAAMMTGSASERRVTKCRVGWVKRREWARVVIRLPAHRKFGRIGLN